MLPRPDFSNLNPVENLKRVAGALSNGQPGQQQPAQPIQNGLNVGFDPFATIKSVAQGRGAAGLAGSGLNSDPVSEFLQKEGIVLRPDQQIRLQQQLSRNDADNAFYDAARSSGFQAGLSNTARNLETQRDLAVNSQKFAADNTTNQLNNLTTRQANNINLINSAMNTAASMFR